MTTLTADDLLVDLSSHNSVTDYSAMRALNSAGWSKATQGGGYVNPLFFSQMNGMANAGMKPGAYHFPDPNVSAADNVAHFLSLAHDWIIPGRLLPMLDVENDVVDGVSWNAGNANAFIPAWVAELRRQTGMADLGVVIYGSDSWWGSTLRPEMWGDLSRLFFMDAIYNGQPGLTNYKHERLAVHQYTDAAPTPGVAKPTDRSVIMRDNGFTLNDLVIGENVNWTDPLPNPNYDQSITDPGDMRSHQSYEAQDWIVQGNLKADRAEHNAAAAVTAVEQLAAKVDAMAQPTIDYDKLGAAIASHLHVTLQGS